jgi:hypothetical protein
LAAEGGEEGLELGLRRQEAGVVVSTKSGDKSEAERIQLGLREIRALIG